MIGTESGFGVAPGRQFTVRTPDLCAARLQWLFEKKCATGRNVHSSDHWTQRLLVFDRRQKVGPIECPRGYNRNGAGKQASRHEGSNVESNQRYFINQGL